MQKKQNEIEYCCLCSNKEIERERERERTDEYRGKTPTRGALLCVRYYNVVNVHDNLVARYGAGSESTALKHNSTGFYARDILTNNRQTMPAIAQMRNVKAGILKATMYDDTKSPTQNKVEKGGESSRIVNSDSQNVPAVRVHVHADALAICPGYKRFW